MAVCRSDYPLADYEQLEISDLFCHRQINSQIHDKTRLQTDRLSDNFSQVPNYSVAVELVRKGHGWTYCPKHAVLEDIRSGKLVILNHPQAVYRWPVGIFWSAGRQPGTIMQHLIDQISRTFP
ncbi:MAG: substrate-binding domain-containing protein [Endozoicomonas sp.]|uniref:substrate-binding domain-containing protein n=1 Tax=Endozoicomonas sp. TaxID=1892382 RepID=UPI003D9BFD98